MTNNDSTKERCRQLLDMLFSSCQGDCDDCKNDVDDFCFYFNCVMLNVIERWDMKKKIEFERARHCKEKLKRIKRVERDVTACCSNCKYSETISLINDKLIPTKRFFQRADGKICHICGKDTYGECELR